MNYQYRELVLFHTKINLKGKKLIEIGGSSPNKVIFDELGVKEYINIESPDYILEMDGMTYSSNNEADERKKTIFCNAEDMGSYIQDGSLDAIFSVACFEHIYELEDALNACYKCLAKGGSLYSYFAPIYTHLLEGDHGVIPKNRSFSDKLTGFHLLSTIDQRKKLIELGVKDPAEIQSILGSVNFNRIPNRKKYEDYERILTESLFYVLELERLDLFNMSKYLPDIVKEIRKSNSSVGNIMTLGFRTLLWKR